MAVDNQILISILSSTVISGFITALFTKSSNNRGLNLKYVTEERQKWRERIREKTAKICSGNYNDKELLELIYGIELSLNPNDNEDKKIVTILNKILNEDENRDYKKQLALHITHLLKYEWEKAKSESESVWARRLPYKRKEIE